MLGVVTVWIPLIFLRDSLPSSKISRIRFSRERERGGRRLLWFVLPCSAAATATNASEYGLQLRECSTDALLAVGCKIKIRPNTASHVLRFQTGFEHTALEHVGTQVLVGVADWQWFSNRTCSETEMCTDTHLIAVIQKKQP